VRKLGFVLGLFLCAGLSGTSWADLIGDEKVLDLTPAGMTPEVWSQVQQEQGQSLVGTGPVVQRCVNGRVLNRFPCQNVDMLAFIPKEALGITIPVSRPDVTVNLNDVWGWTDIETGREFALVGGVDRTTFVEISDPLSPRVLGWLTSHQKMADGSPMRSIWRGIKVYGDFAFIVADAQNQHGMQVFDLRQLLTVRNGPIDFAETAHLPFGSAHNIVMNEETGYAYAVGTSRNAAVGDCQGGLLMINVLDPRNPKRAGCFPDDGYTHDAQCVVYRGPDV
jgi:choice-of-anchor B domain-containing protein